MAELASKIRAKFPGQYDKYDDEELETRWLQKYPGRPEYESLASQSSVERASLRSKIISSGEETAKARAGQAMEATKPTSPLPPLEEMLLQGMPGGGMRTAEAIASGMKGLAGMGASAIDAARYWAMAAARGALRAGLGTPTAESRGQIALLSALERAENKSQEVRRNVDEYLARPTFTADQDPTTRFARTAGHVAPIAAGAVAAPVPTALGLAGMVALPKVGAPVVERVTEALGEEPEVGKRYGEEALALTGLLAGVGAAPRAIRGRPVWQIAEDLGLRKPRPVSPEPGPVAPPVEITPEAASTRPNELAIEIPRTRTPDAKPAAAEGAPDVVVTGNTRQEVGGRVLAAATEAAGTKAIHALTGLQPWMSHMIFRPITKLLPFGRAAAKTVKGAAEVAEPGRTMPQLPGETFTEVRPGVGAVPAGETTARPFGVSTTMGEMRMAAPAPGGVAAEAAPSPTILALIKQQFPGITEEAAIELALRMERGAVPRPAARAVELSPEEMASREARIAQERAIIEENKRKMAGLPPEEAPPAVEPPTPALPTPERPPGFQGPAGEGIEARFARVREGEVTRPPIEDMVPTAEGSPTGKEALPVRPQAAPTIKRQPLASRAYKSWGYNAKNRILELETPDGKTYRYYDVMPEEIAKVQAAESKGKALGEIVRNHPQTRQGTTGITPPEGPPTPPEPVPVPKAPKPRAPEGGAAAAPPKARSTESIVKKMDEVLMESDGDMAAAIDHGVSLGLKRSEASRLLKEYLAKEERELSALRARRAKIASRVDKTLDEFTEMSRASGGKITGEMRTKYNLPLNVKSTETARSLVAERARYAAETAETPAAPPKRPRGRPKKVEAPKAAPATNLGGKAKPGPPPTPPSELEATLEASVRAAKERKGARPEPKVEPVAPAKTGEPTIKAETVEEIPPGIKGAMERAYEQDGYSAAAELGRSMGLDEGISKTYAAQIEKEALTALRPQEGRPIPPEPGESMAGVRTTRVTTVSEKGEGFKVGDTFRGREVIEVDPQGRPTVLGKPPVKKKSLGKETELPEEPKHKGVPSKLLFQSEARYARLQNIVSEGVKRLRDAVADTIGVESARKVKIKEGSGKTRFDSETNTIEYNPQDFLDKKKGISVGDMIAHELAHTYGLHEFPKKGRIRISGETVAEVPKGIAKHELENIPERAKVSAKEHMFQTAEDAIKNNPRIRKILTQITENVRRLSEEEVGRDIPLKIKTKVTEVKGIRKSDATNLAGRLSKPDGGFTFKPGKPDPKKGFAVSPYKGRELILEVKEATPKRIDKYYRDNADLLEKEGHYVGGWHNPENGKVYLDISVVSKTAKEATKIARENKQESYFDLEKMESVSVKE